MRIIILSLLFFLPITANAAIVPVRIVVFGDSMASGYMLGKGEDLATNLETSLIKNGHTVTVYNLSVSGQTVLEAASNVDKAIELRPDIVVVALGMSDALRGLDVNNAIYINLDNINQRFKAAGIQIVLCGIKAPIGRDYAYKKMLESVYYNSATRVGAALIPNLLAPIEGKPELTLADGIHPNSAGVKAIAPPVAAKLYPYVNWASANKNK